MFSQGVYRDSVNYLRIEFDKPILVNELIIKDNWLVTNSSAQIINITGIGFNEFVLPCYGAQCEDTASMYVVLRFDKLQWGMNYKVQLSNAHDTSDLNVNLTFDDVYWSFEDEGNLTLPNTELINSTALSIVGVTASSFFSSTYTPLKAVDSDTSSYWRGDGLPEWISLELNRTANLTLIRLMFRNWWNRTITYDIDVSLDNISWTPILTSVKSSRSYKYTINTFAPVNANYIRIWVSSNSAINRAEIKDIKVKE